jgi:hypothetical protein
MRRIAVAMAAIAIFCAFAGLFAREGASQGALMVDFRAFYCSAKVAIQGADPYATAPLGRCEAAARTVAWTAFKPFRVVPAPLPGYAIALFVPFAFLPFPAAAVVWIAVLLLALGGAIALFPRLQVAPWTVIVVALSVMVGAVSIPFGELPPIALLGLALVAFGVVRNRGVLVGLGLALTMTEPQIGLVLAVVLVALSPRRILVVGAVFGLLLAVSLATIGIAANVEYVSAVLPLHVYSELPRVSQFSLSWIAQGVGFSEEAAILVGRIGFAFALVVAFVSGRWARAQGDPLLAIFLAPVLAVAAGPFVHLDHIALAVPASLWLCTRTPRPPWWALVAPVCLALPLLMIFGVPLLILLVPVITFWIVAAVGGTESAALRSSLVAVVFTGVVAFAATKTGMGHVIMQSAPNGGALSSNSWSVFVRQTFVMRAWTIWLVKAPTWLGIALTILAAFVRLRSGANRMNVDVVE